MENQTPAPGTDEKPLDNGAAGGTPVDQGKDPINPNPPEPDYKVKFSESAKEAQRLLEEKRRLEAELEAERAKNIYSITPSADPIEIELRAQYPDWDTFTDITKQVIRRQHQDSKLLAELAAEKKWQTEINSLVADEKYKGLDKDKEFERFALRPEHHSLPLKTIANAYLFEKNPPASVVPLADSQPPTPVPDEGLPKGSAGPRGEQNSNQKWKASDLKQLRTTDYKKWLEVMKTIDFDDIVEG